MGILNTTARSPHRRTALLALSALSLLLLAVAPMLAPAPIDYAVEVKPILNRNCLSCHGGVRKKAGFSLLFEEEALAATASGKPAILPGDADHSEMIRRLRLTDPEERMPYHKAPLSEAEISILEQWINEGAHFAQHWAYRPVQEPRPPEADGSPSSCNRPSRNWTDISMRSSPTWACSGHPLQRKGP